MCSLSLDWALCCIMCSKIYQQSLLDLLSLPSNAFRFTLEQFSSHWKLLELSSLWRTIWRDQSHLAVLVVYWTLEWLSLLQCMASLASLATSSMEKIQQTASLWISQQDCKFIKFNDNSNESTVFFSRIPEITRILFVFAVFISYALQCYVPISIIWENYVSEKIRSSESSTRYQLLLRLVTTVFTFLVAAAVPELGLFISLFGAFCLSILGLAFPAIMELCVLWPDKLGALNWIMWKDIGLVIFALVGLTSGTYSSMVDIIASFSKTTS